MEVDQKKEPKGKKRTEQDPKKEPWEIDLAQAGFKPTQKNYSHFSNDCCIICQDYSEIDTFASACALPKLWDLSFAGLPDRGVISKSSRGYFNGVILLESFRQLRAPLGQNPSLRDFLESWAKSSVDKTAKSSSTGSELDDAVAAFGMTLWFEFLKARTDPESNNLDEALMTDYIAMARLMFSWVSFSITFDDELVKKLDTFMGRIKLGERSITDALVSGKEVCLGYARMFRIMLNAASGTDHAKLISGLASSLTDGPHKESYQDAVHAWNAFPIVEDALKLSSSPTTSSTKEGSKTASNIEYKVIDPTWARDAERKKVSSVWWSFSNAAMAMSHIPYNYGTWKSHMQFSVYAYPDLAPQDLYVPLEELPRQQNSANKGVVTCKELWEMAQPTLYITEELRWIDISTVKHVVNPVKAPRGTEWHLTVMFKNNCKHQKKDMLATWLYFCTPKTWEAFKNDIARANYTLPYLFGPNDPDSRFSIRGPDGKVIGQKGFDETKDLESESKLKETDKKAPRNTKSEEKESKEAGSERSTWSASATILSDKPVKGIIVVVGAFKNGERIHIFRDTDGRVVYRPLMAWEI